MLGSKRLGWFLGLTVLAASSSACEGPGPDGNLLRGIAGPGGIRYLSPEAWFTEFVKDPDNRDAVVAFAEALEWQLNGVDFEVIYSGTVRLEGDEAVFEPAPAADDLAPVSEAVERSMATLSDEQHAIVQYFEPLGVPVMVGAALGVGDARVSVHHGDKGVERPVQVIDLVRALELQPAFTRIEVGETAFFFARVRGQFTALMDGVVVRWRSDDPGIVSLSAVETASRAGTADVTGVCLEEGQTLVHATTVRDVAGELFGQSQLTAFVEVACEKPLSIGYVEFSNDPNAEASARLLKLSLPERLEIIRAVFGPTEMLEAFWANSAAFVQRTIGEVAGDIWLVEDDGSNPRNLTNHSAFYRRGAVNLDRSELLFESDRDNPQGSAAPTVLNDVFLIGLDGSGLRKVLSNAGYPRFSPTGRIVHSTDADSDGLYEIRIADADGSNPSLIIDDDDASSWSWAEATVSPDAQRIAVTRFSPVTWKFEIVVGRFDGAAVTDLVVLADDGGGTFGSYSPAWSPASDQLVFASDRTGDQEIWLINVDGSGLTNLSQSPQTEDFHPFWATP